MDGDDFEAWYRQAHPRVVNSLYLVSGELDVSRDATDEAFARAAARWSRVSRMASPLGWTCAVALNELRRQLRRRASATRAEQRAQRAEPTHASDVALPDAEVWEAVRALPERQRTTVVLRYVADLPEAEIAAALGVTRGTVASNLARARESLATTLADSYTTEGHA
jgi:RNA polymerase sigma-70 factor (ECF subfamily)